MPDTSVAAQQLALAQKYAAASQAPALALIRQQQARQDALNAARGQSIQGFATAAANLAKGDAAAVQAPFDTAAHTQAGFGAGYSGQMQGAINSDAANSNDFLAKIGSPQHVTAPQAGDAVYHMGGVVPATALSTAGAGFGAAAALQPGNIMARGQQDYTANAFKGADTDQTFADQIKTLAAQNPKVVQDFLAKLQSASRSDAAASLSRDKFNAEYGKGGYKDRAANKPDFFGSAAGGYYAYNPATGKIETAVAGTGPSPQTPRIVGSDKTGRFAYDPNTGTMTPLIDPLKAAPKPAFTPMEISAFKNRAAEAAKFAWRGEYGYPTKDGYPTATITKKEWLSQPQRYMDALATMVDHGIPPNIAENSLNRFWSRPGYGAEVDARMKWVESGMKGTVPTIKTEAARPSRPLYSGKAGAAAKPAASTRDLQAVNLAKEYLGTPYVWGGTKPGAFDCSGLLQYVWGKQGVQIPRVTYDQWKSGTPVARGALRAGDAVFFNMGARGPEHVGMYLGQGQFIEAPHAGAQVRVSDLAGYPGYVGARRYG